jgi:hypothetical protein
VDQWKPVNCTSPSAHGAMLLLDWATPCCNCTRAGKLKSTCNVF